MSDQGIAVSTSANVAASTAPNTVFRGPNGIRAGWRALIFLAIFAGLAAILNLAVYMVVRFVLHLPPHFQIASQLSPAAAALSDGPLFLFSAIAALIMTRIEHRKWQEYGLPFRFAFGRDSGSEF